LKLAPFPAGKAHSLHLAVETAATQTKPTSAGYKTLNFWLVRVGGLRCIAPELHSEGLVQESEWRSLQPNFFYSKKPGIRGRSLF
jgi:hypothetical protein